MKCTLTILAVLILLTSTAYAQVPNISEFIVPMSTAPVLIINIHAGWAPPTWASEKHRAAKQSYEALPIYFQLQNASQKPIYAYRFLIVTYDPLRRLH